MEDGEGCLEEDIERVGAVGARYVVLLLFV